MTGTPTLNRPNVDLITDPIGRIVPDGVVTADGVTRQVDVIIYGTGFRTLDFLGPMSVTGLGGRRLEDRWREGADAYLGISVSGFPNFFMLYGPNTNLGGNSIIYMLEGQIRYVAAALRALDTEGLDWIDVRPEVQRSFNAWVSAIVVSGDSAGGGLALSLVLALRDAGENLPAGCMLASAWLDLSRDRRAVPGLVRRDLMLTPGWLEACARAYAPPAEWTAPPVSPLRARHGGLPPLLIQAGSDELLAPDAEHLAASASAAGADVTYTRWPGMWHDFVLQPGLVAAADSAVAQAAWFVQAVTAAGP